MSTSSVATRVCVSQVSYKLEEKDFMPQSKMNIFTIEHGLLVTASKVRCEKCPNLNPNPNPNPNPDPNHSY